MNKLSMMATPFIAASAVMAFAALCGFILGYTLPEMRGIIAVFGGVSFFFGVIPPLISIMFDD